MNKLTNFVHTMKDFINSGFEISSSGVAEHRLTICHACEHYNGGFCNICGCNMILKTKIAAAECPILKWSQSTAVSGEFNFKGFTLGGKCGGC